VTRYRKKALIVTAEPATQDQYLTTLEGVSTVHKGDMIVTGIDNEQWAIRPEWFHQAYTHIKGNQYRRKPQLLDAVQIHDIEYVSAPTGPIRGDPGDYKITGTKGEQWFCKPDIFDKTYERVSKSMDTKSVLSKAIDDIGLLAVARYLPKGYKIYPCDLHGHFLAHYSDKNPLCPLCIHADPHANGTTATEIEHWIDLKDGINPYTDHDGF